MPPPRPTHFDRSIIEGSLGRAVWRIAWPTMLQNAIGGLQGIIDHALVGHFVGYTANAAIGVSWQIFLVVIVFISSLYAGMGVLVARFAGAGDRDAVDHAVGQAFLVSLVLAGGIMAPVGYLLSPRLLLFINAAPEVREAALPFLRLMFVGGIGLLTFFLLGGAFRAAGDPRTPLRLGIILTTLNVLFNVVLIRGAGPIPAFGATGAAMGTVAASLIVAALGLAAMRSPTAAIHLPSLTALRPDWAIIRQLFKFGLPTGFQGVAMNVGGVFLLRYIGALPQSAHAQAAYAISYTELFSLITFTSVGVMGATAAVVGQNLGAGKGDRAWQAVGVSSRLAFAVAVGVGLLFLTIPGPLLAIFGVTDPVTDELGRSLLRHLAVSGLFVTVALAYTGALQGSGDTRSPLYISIVSQVLIPLGLCALWQRVGTFEPVDIWRAIVVGHMTRCLLSIARFRQGKWQRIVVDLGQRVPDESRPEVT
ncbi:MATE family efflux transporter [Luteitalea sp. TBR-22]|uniref:MATE family efflux transporter n=1 Tax=Luteitalea sp. TBR-22 TaxID=2802971 RepID=UPI001AFA2355|nr:MATE family efflux transporter [Luteitalea sp. TBR-22]BCS33429.1 MATE family efflux transporter [Luteitalea sp. TBR-22]